MEVLVPDLLRSEFSQAASLKQRQAYRLDFTSSLCSWKQSLEQRDQASSGARCDTDKFEDCWLDKRNFRILPYEYLSKGENIPWT